jgi:peptide/nickel transport system substrate-binding protein
MNQHNQEVRMKNRWKILKTCAYLLLVAVLGTISVLAACSSTATQTPAPTTTAATKPAATTSKVPNATADRIRICIPAGDPDSLDPTSSAQLGAQIIEASIYDSLVELDYDSKVRSSIATWEFLDGGKCVEFKVHQGIKFTNGDPLTARDVEFSFLRRLEKSPRFKGEVRFYDHVQVVDDYTIRFYLTQPNSLFLTQNCPSLLIASKNYFEKAGETEFKDNPVGSGPYKFVKWERGQYVDLERNDDYWGKKPQVKQAHIVWSVESTTAAAMLKAGEIDFLMDAAWTLAPDLEKMGYKMVKFSPMLSYALQFHMMNPNVPWANLKVRQAIDYAIDKEAIISKVFHNIPAKVEWLAPWELGYDPTLKPAYPYDLAKAKALLAEAGYPNGFKMPIYRGSLWGPGAADVVEYLTLALSEIGIEVENKYIEGPALVDFIRSTHTDSTAEVTAVTGMTFSGCADPVHGLANNFYSPNPATLYYTPELDAIINKALATLDDAQRGELIKQAYQIIDKDLPVVPILVQTIVYMMRPNMDYRHRGRAPGGLFISEITIE